MRRDKRFTIYDVMEANGVFDSNPANAISSDYEGPVSYPQMFYHPQGESRVLVPGEAINTPLGVQVVGEQRELINQIARTKIEADALRASGWHDHPAKAIAASGKAAPAVSPDMRIKDLEAQIRALQAAQADARAEKQAETIQAATQAREATKHTIKSANKAVE